MTHTFPCHVTQRFRQPPHGTAPQSCTCLLQSEWSKQSVTRLQQVIGKRSLASKRGEKERKKEERQLKGGQYVPQFFSRTVWYSL